jgi:hypothetical protein
MNNNRGLYKKNKKILLRRISTEKAKIVKLIFCKIVNIFTIYMIILGKQKKSSTNGQAIKRGGGEVRPAGPSRKRTFLKLSFYFVAI